ncbi:phosphonate metabolism transcriptional regulator PhnF [Roseospira marina]|uniref:Phosphonate metabolism transcriptional regulator PhnF n=1 Tax=Roseospira marina TaxID=140057 RepID=A0A5M6I931_9PROT|nr:phosphonate metabolism transcriptional regulator PhnF [Roseospira marina]KAA5604662.1 phosphonate metabolism transcriptional regulator PhnF [Roseospira marina]MBB4315107.1 GntR family phosphonate transport system transcriptional regulator [Roseospira marina]MBB5088123.1 GntR family phosphonate transport system transcriptional regulator [Roseospira marina]
MVLARRSGVALWRQVQAHVETALADGTLKPGDQIPTEAQMADRFGVNRHTIRRAMAELEDRGLIRVEQGRGSFVQEPILSYRIGQCTRFTDNVIGENRRPSRAVVDVRTLRAEGLPADALGLRPQDTLACVSVVSDCDGHRVSYSDHFFSARRFPGIDDAVRAERSVTAALRRFGIMDYRRKWTQVTARMPTARDAEWLHQNRTRPILLTESLNVDSDGHPIEFGRSQFSSDWVQIVFEP